MNTFILFGYSVILFLLQPLALVYLFWRARKQPEYAKNLSERFALYLKKRINPASRRIWIHAVSLGETRAAYPLIKKLYLQQPDAHVILTHTTPTGRAAGQELFSVELDSGQMTQVYVPYDLYSAVARFMRAFSPTDVWVIETEIWPNMVAACVRRSIPISLLNGRLSAKSLQQTLKVLPLMRIAYNGFYKVCAQTDLDAQRYQQLGVSSEQLVVTGNLKFDMEVPTEQLLAGQRIKELNQYRPTVVLASTRDGEEAMWLESLSNNNQLFPDNIQWWLIPRHPQRFDDVEELINTSGLMGKLLRKSKIDSETDELVKAELLQQAKIVLGDTMGQMFSYYALADIVLMGGAWLPLGGQNFIEPLSVGKPTIIGPHTFNFAQASADAVTEGALIQCEDMQQALAQVCMLLNNIEMYKNQQNSAKFFGFNHQGAVQKTLQALNS